MQKNNPALWQAIKASGLKQDHIANLVGITSKQLSDTIYGRWMPSQDQCLELAKILGVKVGQLDLSLSLQQDSLGAQNDEGGA